MFADSATPRIFALPPGADFPGAIAAGVMARMAGQPPEALARVELFLNTGRMLRAVTGAFARMRPGLMPRLRLIGDLAALPMPGTAPAEGPLIRRLALLPLVRALVAASGPTAPGPSAFQLAESLARLVAEMQDEGLTPDALELQEVATEHALHWQRSLAFLRIVAPYFGDAEAPDVAARQRRAVEALAARWATMPPGHPVIVAGSTGSRGTTALLLRAVAALPQGAVVLPNFDFDMPEAAWRALEQVPTPIEDHPQYRFLRLCRSLGTGPDAVRDWGFADAPDPARNRVISLALRPAPVTDAWLAEGPALGDLVAATGRLSLIEAADAGNEAKAIALCLRHGVEDGQRVALVTPDRTLARRVAAALDRWGIVPDDSAGEPLSQTATGRLLRQIASLFGTRVTAADLLTLLKHPLVAAGAARGPHLLAAHELELHVRRHGPAFPLAADLTGWGTEVPRHSTWAGWVAGVLAALEPSGPYPLTIWAGRVLTLAEVLRAGPEGTDRAGLWADAAGRAARAALADLIRHGTGEADFAAADFADALTTELGRGSVRADAVADPRVAIWGTLEARVQGADLLVLAGLNEGIWPVAPPPDPWLSRQMRLRAGLLLPERQIGLSAHDFQGAVGAARVVLSRAVRSEEAEAVPSRWLLRLTNLLEGLPGNGGAEAMRAMRARGAEWTGLARAIEHPGHPPCPAPRPAPRPPVAARPRELPVTAIGALITDPYAVYARYVLRLRRLDPLRAEADARLRGNVLHAVMEGFIASRPPLDDMAAARAQLLTAADRALEDEVPWPVERRLWRARVSRFADGFLAAERRRAAAGVPKLFEMKGQVVLHEPPFRLTARPDRIDVTPDGALRIFDYKTGSLPTKEALTVGERQLSLEGAMAMRGAFTHGDAAVIGGLTYLQLSEAAAERQVPHDAAALERGWDDLIRLLGLYLQRETGYSARSRADARRTGDYDDLARFGEWAMHDRAVAEDLE